MKEKAETLKAEIDFKSSPHQRAGQDTSGGHGCRRRGFFPAWVLDCSYSLAWFAVSFVRGGVRWWIPFISQMSALAGKSQKSHENCLESHHQIQKC